MAQTNIYATNENVPPNHKMLTTKRLGTQQDDSARCFSLAPNLYKTQVVKDARPSRTFCEFIGHNSPTSNKIFLKQRMKTHVSNDVSIVFIFCREFIVTGALYDIPDND